MTKNRFRAITYFASAFLGSLALDASNAHDVHAWIVALLKASAAGALVLRAYADQTPTQDGHEPEPVMQAPPR